MQSHPSPIPRLSICLVGLSSFLLALGLLTTAQAQDGQKTQPKDQPTPPKSNEGAAKKDAPKTPPVKLGLSLNDPKAYQGYTLLSAFVSPNTYLVDMQGRVVNTWKTDCSPALCAELLENGHLLRPGSIGGDASVFGPGPGVGGRVQEFTWEGELVWDFRFYNAKQLPHHNLTRLPNGNVLMIVWDRKTSEEAIAAGRRPEMAGDKHMLPDSLVEIKPTGKTTGQVVWEWHLWDHLIQDFDKTKTNYGDVASHPELVNINFGEDEVVAAKDAKDKDTKEKDKAKKVKSKVDKDKVDKDKVSKDNDKVDSAKLPPAPPKAAFRVDPDFTHFNGVAFNADLDQISISVWKFSEFWIIDHSTTTAEAASHHGGRSGKGGDLLYRWGNPRNYRAGTKNDQKLFNQHNAHWIPKGLPGAGNILVFNNGPGRPGGAHSSVDELVLPVDSQGRYVLKAGTAYGPGQAIWSYTAPKKADFFSSFISGAQRLPNGNTLICSGANGTIFEVTPEKEVVWKYVNPTTPGAPFGPPRQPAQIMSPIAGEMLAISPVQRLRLNDIQKDIDARLDRLLTEVQKKQISEPTAAGGYGPFSQPGKVMAGAEQNRLKLTDDQKKDIVALQKSVDGRFDSVLTEAQKKQLKSVFSPAGPVQVNQIVTKGGAPLTGVILSQDQQNTLKFSAEQKKRMAEIQKDVDAKLQTLLTEDQQKQLTVMRQNPPGAKTVVNVGGGAGPAGGAQLFRAYRYGIDHPAFEGRKLTPGKTLEEMQPKEADKKVIESKK